MTKDEKEIKSQIKDWLIDVLGQTDITNNSLNELIDNEYDNYIMKQEYEKMIDKKDFEINTLKEVIDTLYDEIGKWQNGEYVSNKVAKQSFEMRDKLQTQKAIECLKEVKEQILKFEEIHYQFLGSGKKIPMVSVLNFRIKEVIDTKIKELEGEK